MTLKELFTNIANAIRSATGATGKIKASDFAAKINAINYRGAWGTTINPGGSVTIPAGYHNGSGKVSATNNFVISNASLIFRGGNGEGHATSYKTTAYYRNLLVSYARGELQISGNYGNRINLGNIIEAGTAIRDLAIFTNVSAGTTFTNPTFNPSVTNGGLIIYALS